MLNLNRKNINNNSNKHLILMSTHKLLIGLNIHLINLKRINQANIEINYYFIS